MKDYLKVGDFVKSIHEFDKDFGIMIIEKIHGDNNCKMVGLDTLFLSDELEKVEHNI